MAEICFTVPGPVRGKARARMTKRGFAYTPKETVMAENLVKMCFREAAPAWKPAEGPVRLTVRSYHRPPSSWSKKMWARLEAGEQMPCTKRPDFDNVGKLVGDALNGIAYNDDKQVWNGHVTKIWGLTERLEVELCFEDQR